MSDLVIVDLEQGTPEWLELRKTKRTASETPAIMGTSKWQGPADVFDTKTGTKTFEGNAATRHGNEMEPRARAALELKLGIDGHPVVGYRGDYLASLDHYSPDTNGVADVKCPFSGERSSTWKAALQGLIEPGYADQLEHQYRVFLPERIGLFVYLSDTMNAYVPYAPSDQRWGEIQRAWDAFWEKLVKGERPNREHRSDQSWLIAAVELIEAKNQLAIAQLREEAAKRALISLADGKSAEGCGVRVVTFGKGGAVDYKKMVSTLNLDVEPFRKAGTVETRVELIKKEEA